MFFKGGKAIATVSVEVENVGSFSGKECIQVYAAVSPRILDRPPKELICFKKTKRLEPGERERLALSFSVEDLAVFVEQENSYILESGTYTVFVGNNAINTTLCGSFAIDKCLITKRVQPISVSHPIQPMNLKPELPSWAEELSAEELAYICIGDYRDGDGIGSIIGGSARKIAGAAGETTNRFQQLPAIIMADGPAGLRLNVSKLEQDPTALPIGTALAQSWNLDAVFACGDIVGSEMKEIGIHLWLAPALNIHRSPMCGRNFEYFSEDPPLSGKIAAAMTNGVQKHKGCGVVIKHFACNNQETNRFHSNSIVSQRALREIYLKGFEICVREASPMAIMTSYNLLNGVHTCNHYGLLTNVLRTEWGFKGVVMTDWLVTLPLFGQQKHPHASAAECIKAGNDLIMPGTEFDYREILAAIRRIHPTCTIATTELTQSVSRIIALISKIFF